MAIPFPVLRAGKPYRSLDTVTLTDIRDGEPVAEVSQANRGLIARDLARKATEPAEALREKFRSMANWFEICRARGRELFEGEAV